MTVRTRWQQRQAPFLQRNLTRRVQALQDSTAMGNIVSSPPHKGSQHHNRRHQVDRDGAPPLKSFRLSSPDALDVDHLIASPQPSDARPDLRIEVLKVFHKNSKIGKTNENGNASAPRDVINTKATCRVTISESGAGGRSRVLHCESQVCDVQVMNYPIDPHRIARIRLPNAFFIPETSILVTRPDGEDFGFSDSYQVLIELEAASDGLWPPLDATDLGVSSEISNAASTPGRTWILSSQWDKIFGRLRSPLCVSTGYSSQALVHQTDYVMDVDMSWNSRFKTQAHRRLEKSSKPGMNAIGPSSELLTDEIFVPSEGGTINSTINPMNDQAMEEPLDIVEELEGAQTPSRSLRSRGNKTYNLKVLSDQAQGKERKRRARETQAPLSTGQLTYLLPPGQLVCVDPYRCVTCGLNHQTILHLRLHLEAFHSGFEYLFQTTHQGPQFLVRKRSETLTSPSETFELGRPVKPFDLQSFVAGDQSWLLSRLPLDSVDDVFKISNKELLDRLPSHSPLAIPKPMQLRRDRSKRNRVLVPDIPQVFFDPISRAQLVPGQEVPNREPDSTWLIHKHRDNVREFTDVTAAEKEFIEQWDEHIIKRYLSSAAYLPRAWLDFVREKADWLVAAKQRMHEFGKHASVLLARDMLDNDTVEEAFSCINEARMKQQVKRDETEEGTSALENGTRQSATAQIQRSTNGCALCQLPVLGPTLLVCANKKCPRRLYHASCAAQDLSLLDDKRKWLCHNCSALETS